MTTTGRVDLTDVELFVRGDHHAAFEHLRATEPIYWNEGADGAGFWALTTYADVVWAYRDHAVFGSERGAILGGSYRSESDTAGGRMLVATDLPRHRLLKQHIQPAMSPSVAARTAEVVHGLVAKAVARAVADGGCDFATDIATELPAGALMVIMGIGHQDAHRLIELTRSMVGFRDDVFVDTTDDPQLRLAMLQAEIFEFFAELVDERAADPSGDDLVSRLLRARVNGRRLSEDEIYYNCMNVAVGGNETSSYTACTGLLALIEHPDQYTALLADPGLTATAIDEMLRWSSTNAYVQRVAKSTVRRGDVEIRGGDSVTLWNVSANRDEAQFPAADRFDITRTPNRHLSYGSGIHRCVGSPVAESELSVLFGHLGAEGIRFEPAGEPRRLRSNFILGLTRLPVRVAGR
ncbi:cytochrome P450 [Actinophytocola sp. NPDC049390]|uniref:cytochrome P450 n=1 Tax=Actinophytocola sp. NPDC049390 TaxID=3363894 RepID=UPI0037A9D58E